jgi:transglutaminase superfamily protein
MPRRRFSTPRTEAALDEALDAVTFAIRIFPGVNRCLETSLVAWLFLARRGFDVELIVAVRRYPFAAHAWVELVPSRRVLTSRARRAAEYTVIVRRQLITEASQPDRQADPVASGPSVVSGVTG